MNQAPKIKSRKLTPAEDVAQERARHDHKQRSRESGVIAGDSSVRYWVLGKLVSQRRQKEGLSLRDVARLTNVSASTLSRIENGKTADTDHVAALTSWLGIAIERIAGPVREDTQQAIKSILLSDPSLSAENAEALCGMFTALYAQLQTPRAA